MLRTALKPRWLALLLLVVVLIAAFIQLGRWQLGVAEDKAATEAIAAAASRPVVPLESLLRPHQPFPNLESTRRVSVVGEYEDGQVLVGGRRLDGVEGIWVITPFRVTATGGVLGVLRGFVTDPAQVTDPPTGQLTLTGGLAPGESPYAGPELPAGQVGSVDLSVLVNQWSGELYNAFIFLESQSPPTGSALTLVPTPTVEPDLNWRNLAYALQWWAFAIFALWMWWRMVRQAHAEEQEQEQEQEPAGEVESVGDTPGADDPRSPAGVTP
ncbi:MAG: SURF1 family protein [Phycicoccus sp.]|nr:SURF1 family protein [Phycicoccus sp.]